MKPVDYLTLKQLEKMEDMMVVHHLETTGKLDKILAMLLKDTGVVSPELEAAVKSVSARALSIDQKVPDKQ